MNLASLEPSIVSKDLKGYAIGIYGASGSGKTTTATQFGNAIVMDTELGTKALGGIFRQPVLTWIDCLTFVNQLKQPAVKERFDTVVIDTIGALVSHAEKYVLDHFGATDLNDMKALPYGKGHTELSKMFYYLFNTILEQGYGLIVVGHEKSVVDTETEETFVDIDIANKRVKKYIVSLLDVLMYVEKTRNPDAPNTVYFKTTEKAEAKCRFPNVIANAVFNYENIHKALTDAIPDGVEERINFHEKEEYTQEEYTQLKDECEALGKQVLDSGDNARITELVKLIEQTTGKKISQTTKQDVPLLKELKKVLTKFVG